MSSMEDRDGVIWQDGRLTPWREARVHLLSYTFLHGAGVFEGVRVYDGERGPAVFRLEEHTDRFLDSARMLQMALPYSRDELIEAQRAVVAANGLRQGYIRPLGYWDGQAVGVSAAGNAVHVAIACWPWDDYLGGNAREAGIRVKTSSFSRHHIGAVLGKAKANGHYVNSMLAATEAKQQGYGDALMLDPQGCVAECSTSNVFMVRRGKLSTPDRTNILEGITRASILELAREAGLEVEERRITRDELYVADEMFVTGTAIEVTPVVELDNRAIGEGRPGPVTRKLQDLFFAAALGRDPIRRGWLTPVADHSEKE